MTKEQTIKYAQECGLIYTGESAEEQAEYMGTELQWRKFSEGQVEKE